MKHCITGIIAFLLVTITVEAQRPFTAEDLWKLHRIGACEISPDGATAAVVITRYDIKENKGVGDIWLYSLEDGSSRQFTTGKSSEGSPAFSPDGKWLVFTAKRDDDERAQLYLIGMQGGEARRLTDMPLGASSPKWFPDGKRIAFVSGMLPGVTEMDTLRSIIKKKKDDKVTARISENRLYRYWDRYLTDGYIDHLFTVNVDDLTVTNLTPRMDRYFNHAGGIDYDIAPDGSEIVATALSKGAPYDELFTDIYTIAVDGSGRMINLTEANPASDWSPRYSSTGQYILYGRNLRMDMNAENTQLIRRDRRTGEEIELCREFDRSPTGWITDAEDNTVYFTAEHYAKRSIFSVPMSGGAVTTLLHAGSNSSLSLAGEKLVFLHQHLSAPNALHIMNPDGSGLRKLGELNATLLDSLSMGRVEDVWYIGAEGDSVQMFVVYPPDFNARKKWPLLVLLHGGPHGTFGDDFHPRWNAQVFACAGYVTIMPNFHGSTGFGEYFADRINGEHPRLPFIDVMLAVDEMVKRPYIDSTRMAAGGGSYGGYLASWVGAHTSRFACLVNHAGVYNLMAQFGSDVTQMRHISYGGMPWDGRDNVLRWSPSQYAETYETPTLVIHGEKDYRVPYGQALEVYGMLKARGVPARIVLYPDENHWILSARNSIHWYGEFISWIDRWAGAGGK
jgi:dipeptidyl aminopeptidase/acylaminoacyl peptidase